MSHQIFEDDQMFYVGSHGVPWHKLGNPVPDLATLTEALDAANLNWNVNLEPIKTKKGVCFPDRFMTVREDTGRPLGIVSNRYNIVQNRELGKLVDDITKDPNGPKFVTAGSLNNGERVWFLAVFPEFIRVTQKDIIKQYLLITTGHNARHKCHIKEVNTRVVCANTLGGALGEAGRGIAFKHIGDMSMKVEDAQNALGIIRENNMLMKDIIIDMSKKQMTKAQEIELLEKLYPISSFSEPTPEDDKNIVANLAIDRLWHTGKGNSEPETAGSFWTFYNAITEFEDHFAKGFSKKSSNADAEKKFVDSIWGEGSKKKTEAMTLIGGML